MKKEEQEKVIFRISRELKNKLMIYCIENETSMQKLLSEFVEDILKLS